MLTLGFKIFMWLNTTRDFFFYFGSRMVLDEDPTNREIPEPAVFEKTQFENFEFIYEQFYFRQAPLHILNIL